VDESENLLEFPCQFPIKVMGRDQAGFEAHVLELISTHVGEITPDNVVVRGSRNGNFLAITVMIQATSREQLDNVYRALTANQLILYVI
jgi:putative lipoic acid-binding regulatory protein